jgi:hypothetical protein
LVHFVQVKGLRISFMSTRYDDGSTSENHKRGAELHNVAAHEHRVADHNGNAEHLTGHEHSQQALEHSPDSRQHAPTATVGHGVAAFGHHDIEALAHKLWEARGCPDGSPEEDWFQAVKVLRSRGFAH